MRWTWLLQHEVGGRDQFLITELCWPCDSIQTDRVKAQVDLTHGMLREWYLSNIKNAPKQPKQSRTVGTGAAELHASSEQRTDELGLRFSVFADLTSELKPCLLCRKATFNPGWLRVQGSRLFRCICGNKDDLDYTCKLRSPFRVTNLDRA